MMKPGYKTSEFWFTLVSFVFSGLYLVGLIGDINQKDDLIRDVSHGVESMILIGGQLAILARYINGRKEIKKAWWSAVAQEPEIEKYEGEKNVSKRPSTKKPRRTSKSNKKIS